MGRREKTVIPQQVDELTADWFSTVLGGTDRVTHVETTVIGTDVGFMGEIYRCGLTWQNESAAGPTSVVVKVPSNRPENKTLAEGVRAYEREIDVYQQLHNDLGLPMPAHHYSAMDPDPAPWLERPILFLFKRLPVGGVGWLLDSFLKLSEKSTRRYILVIEDIDDARPPSQAAGGSLADSEVALGLLAKFHAENWMRQAAIDACPRIQPLNLAPKAMQAAYRRNRDSFADQFRSSLGPRGMTPLDEIQEQVVELSDDLCRAPWTILHGDYRLDNLLYRPDDAVVVIDYQAVTWGRPGYDVAYFITTALSPEHKAEEEALLRTYHGALIDAGITDYSWPQLVADCRLSKGLLAHRFVGGRDLLDSTMTGADENFIDLLARRMMGWLDD